LVLVLEMAALEHFGWKCSQNHLGVNWTTPNLPSIYLQFITLALDNVKCWDRILRPDCQFITPVLNYVKCWDFGVKSPINVLLNFFDACLIKKYIKHTSFPFSSYFFYIKKIKKSFFVFCFLFFSFYSFNFKYRKDTF